MSDDIKWGYKNALLQRVIQINMEGFTSPYHILTTRTWPSDSPVAEDALQVDARPDRRRPGAGRGGPDDFSGRGDPLLEVMAAGRSLPETERAVVALLCMSCYSHR